MRHPTEIAVGSLLLVLSAGAAHAAAAAPASPAPAAPTERRLHVASAEASSYLVNDWNKFQENYLPLYVADGDPRTAWTHGAKPGANSEGVGEWLRMKVTPMAGATQVRLRVRNGYQKTPKLFAANARAKGITVVLLPSGKSTNAELTDADGWQEVVAAQPAGALEAVELRVRSVYAGKKYSDLCISDVELMVTATTPENPAFEKGRLDQILKWKKERMAAAKLFKSGAAKSLPLAPQYVKKDEDWEESDGAPKPPACKMKEIYCRVDEHLAAARRHATGDAKRFATVVERAATLLRRANDFTPVQVVTRDKRKVPTVDGICRPELAGCDGDPCYQSLPLPSPGVVGYLDAGQLSSLEIKGSPSIEAVLDGTPKECSRPESKTWAYALRGAAGSDGAAPLEALMLATCGMVSTREGYDQQVELELLVFGAGGKLELLATPEAAATLRWRDGTDGPVIAGGSVAQSGGGWDIVEATPVAAAQ